MQYYLACEGQGTVLQLRRGCDIGSKAEGIIDDLSCAWVEYIEYIAHSTVVGSASR